MAIRDWSFTPGLNFEREFDKLRKQMDDVFGRIGIGARTGFPALNIYDEGEDILISVQAPGVRKEELKVELLEDTLMVTGSRSSPKYPDSSILRDEIDYGEFKRSFRLPVKVRDDKIEAHLKNGILLIRLPKSEDALSKQIAISV